MPNSKTFLLELDKKLWTAADLLGFNVNPAGSNTPSSG